MVLSNREFLVSLSQSAAALALSALILIAGYLIFSPDLAAHRTDATRSDPRPWTFQGSDLIARMGSGEATEDKRLTITELEHGIDDRAIFTRRTNLKASDYPFLEYKITDRHPGERFYLIWRRQDNPDEMYNARLFWAGDRSTVRQLAGNEDWRGTVTEIGLDVYGDLREQPPVIEFLKLSPSAVSLLARAIWDEWNVFREWTQKSAHHLRGTPEVAILSPTVAAAAWAGLALLLLFLLHLYKRQSGFVNYIIAVAVPWIALDLLWQSNLSKQLNETKYLFAGKTQNEKHLADWESELYQYAQHLKQNVLPEPGVRIFLLNSKPLRSYQRVRAQYYLLPHNIFNYGSFPRPKHIQPGDYFLVLGEVEDLQFNDKTSSLTWDNQSLPVTRLNQHVLGEVYRYEGKP